MTLDKCMEETSSTQLIEWMIVLDELEWKTATRECQYLAQIAAEVHNIPERMFAKSPKIRNLKDFLLEMKDRVFDDTTSNSETRTVPRRKEPKRIEIGSDEAKESPKWQAVTANAKMKWSMFLRKPIP
jgi:hypothetical protein